MALAIFLAAPGLVLSFPSRRTGAQDQGAGQGVWIEAFGVHSADAFTFALSEPHNAVSKKV